MFFCNFLNKNSMMKMVLIIVFSSAANADDGYTTHEERLVYFNDFTKLWNRPEPDLMCEKAKEFFVSKSAKNNKILKVFSSALSKWDVYNDKYKLMVKRHQQGGGNAW